MRVFRYELPLTTGIRLGTETLRVRRGVLLERDGRWSEAAPLPHFSVESEAEVVEALRAGATGPASLQFARDALNTDWQSCCVPVNALLQGEPNQILRQCAALAESSCRALKLKVGRRDLQQEAELVCQVRDRIRADQSLRLDANRAWDFSTATEFARRIQGVDLEYIEEPLREATRLDEFARTTGVAYALDETLAENPAFADFQLAQALVIKPTILGSFRRIEELAAWGKRLVFSACYESGVGICRIAQWAHLFSPTLPAGLDTYRWLARDVTPSKLSFCDWQLEVRDPLSVDEARLEVVPL